jgi:hypothetical protein
MIDYKQLISGKILTAGKIDLRRPFSDPEETVQLLLEGTDWMEHMRQICGFQRSSSLRSTLRLENPKLERDPALVQQIETSCGIAISISEGIWELYFPDIEEYNRVVLPRLQVLIYFPDPFGQDKIEEDIERIRFKTTSV